MAAVASKLSLQNNGTNDLLYIHLFEEDFKVAL